ncbi:hypothetical protein BC830DRAFT_1109351 [Chytriomyces sp. MP71]|nr:hypothetical protein BC830DRAFT_1109351 [Chytriomyces sp. MP71]
MLATDEQQLLAAASEQITVKTMTTKDLFSGELPEEDVEDTDYVPAADEDQDPDAEHMDDMDDDDDDDEAEPEADEQEIDAEEVHDLNMMSVSMDKGKVLRSGLTAAGNYRDVTIMDPLDDDEDDEDYEDIEDDGEEYDDEDDEEEDETPAEHDDEDVDEEEVKDNINNMLSSVGTSDLLTKDATILRHGKEIPSASQAEVDLAVRMQELMQQELMQE